MERTQDASSIDTTTLVIIERDDGAGPSYLSLKLGRDFGQPNGAWTADRAQATRMQPDSASAVIERMPEHEAPACKAVPA